MTNKITIEIDLNSDENLIEDIKSLLNSRDEAIDYKNACSEFTQYLDVMQHLKNYDKIKIKFKKILEAYYL